MVNRIIKTMVITFTGLFSNLKKSSKCIIRARVNLFLAVTVISLILILTTLPPECSSNMKKQFYFTEKIKIVPQIEEAIENRTKSEIESLKLKIDSLQSELLESKHIQTAVQKEKLTADVKITQLLGVQNEQADLLKLRDERIQV